MTHLFDLSGCVAMVTGAASGLGLSAASCLAELGAMTYLCDLDEQGVMRAAAALASSGLRAQARVLDVRNLIQQRLLFEEIVSSHGRLDIVMANAGVSGGRGPVTAAGAVESVDPGEWQSVIGINLTGTFQTLQCACAQMKRFRSGRIIVTTSASVLAPEPFVSYSYAASKAGLNAVVRELAVEMAGYNVCVNAIAPGPFSTPIANGAMTDPAVQQVLSKRIALGRLGEPDEIRGLVALLASNASSFMTGQVISLGGGYPSPPLRVDAHR